MTNGKVFLGCYGCHALKLKGRAPWLPSKLWSTLAVRCHLGDHNGHPGKKMIATLLSLNLLKPALYASGAEVADEDKLASTSENIASLCENHRRCFDIGEDPPFLIFPKPLNVILNAEKARRRKPVLGESHHESIRRYLSGLEVHAGQLNLPTAVEVMTQYQILHCSLDVEDGDAPSAGWSEAMIEIGLEAIKDRVTGEEKQSEDWLSPLAVAGKFLRQCERTNALNLEHQATKFHGDKKTCIWYKDLGRQDDNEIWNLVSTNANLAKVLWDLLERPL